MKTEVYSWRLSSELKSDIEREARLRKTGISSILDMAVRAWLERSHHGERDDQRQRKLHAAAANHIGVLAGNNPRRAETARKVIRQRLSRRYAR
jgi:hypothetical protein